MSFRPSLSTPLDTRDVPVVPVQEYPSQQVQQQQQRQDSRNPQSQPVSVGPQQQPNVISVSVHVAQPPAPVVSQDVMGGMEAANQAVPGMVDLGMTHNEIVGRSQLQQAHKVHQQHPMIQHMSEVQVQMQAQPEVTAAVAGIPAEIDINDLGSVALPDLLNQINPQLMGDFSSDAPEIMNLLMQQRMQAAHVPAPVQQVSTGGIVQIPGPVPDSSLSTAILSQEIANPSTSNAAVPQKGLNAQGVLSSEDVLAPALVTAQFEGQIGVPVQAAQMSENFGYLNKVVGNLHSDGMAMHPQGAVQGGYPAGSGQPIMASLPEAVAGAAARPASFPVSQLSVAHSAASALKRPRPENKAPGTAGSVPEVHQNQFAVKEELQTVPGSVGGSGGSSSALYKQEVQGDNIVRIDGLPEVLEVLDDKTEEKRKLRAERNRQSAAASRERKKHHIKELERRVSMLSRENALLQVGQLEVFKRRLKVEKNLLEENATLKKKLFMQDMTIQSLTQKLDDMGMPGGKEPMLKRPNTWSGERWGRGKGKFRR